MIRLLLVTVFLLASNAFAWGPMGHKIVAEVAESSLNPNTLLKVKAILGQQTLADVATWADSIRNQANYEHTKTWHYVSIEDGENYEVSVKNPEGDVIEAIESYKNILKSNAPKEKKLEALKFIIHFVGDMHQPLHVGRAEDRGGNEIHVTFQGKSFNLHALWDSGLIEFQQVGVKDYARRVQSKQRMLPKLDLDYDMIVKENMDLRKQVYDFRQTDLSGLYFQVNLDTLDSRLLVGGKRLAQLLNTVLP